VKIFVLMPAAVRERVERYVVVNDGSTDDTAAALDRLRTQFPNLVALRHEVNRGYGGTQKTLISYAVNHGADVGIGLHSDGQYSPESIPDLMAPFDEDTADIVQGSRMLGGGALRGNMPLYKFVANKSLTAIENWAFGLRLAEYHSGYMLYSRKAMMAVPFQKLSDSFDFDLEMIVMAKVKGLRIREIAIPTIYADEVSHLRPVQYGMRVLKVVRDYKLGKYRAL
jgi:glycosyltransferase involved in cell wall biosynthesis